MRLVVVGELVDLPLGHYSWNGEGWTYDDGDEEGWSRRWAGVEHLESTVRLVLARRLGRFSHWADWIELDAPVGDGQWAELLQQAWQEVGALGKPA